MGSDVADIGEIRPHRRNTGTNIGGRLSPTLTPWLAEHCNWTVSLGVAAGVATLGSLLWLLTRTGDRLKR